MNDDSTRENIFKIAEDLILKQGYENTSLKQIAEACGMRQGNLYYYIKKKEELFIKLFQRYMLKLPDQIERYLTKDENQWEKYIIIEYIYLLKMVNDSQMFHLYIEALNVPAMKEFYIKVHNDLLMRYITADSCSLSKSEIFMNSIAFCGSTFEIIKYYFERKNEIDIDSFISIPIRVQLLLFGFSNEEIKKIISKSYAKAKKIAKEMNLY